MPTPISGFDTAFDQTPDFPVQDVTSVTPPSGGLCEVFVLLAGANGTEKGYLRFTDLPLLGADDAFVVGRSQTKTASVDTQRITFDPVPQGAEIFVTVPDAGLFEANRDAVIVPFGAETFQITQ